MTSCPRAVDAALAGLLREKMTEFVAAVGGEYHIAARRRSVNREGLDLIGSSSNSLLEERGFEPPVPLTKRVGPSGETESHRGEKGCPRASSICGGPRVRIPVAPAVSRANSARQRRPDDRKQRTRSATGCGFGQRESQSRRGSANAWRPHGLGRLATFNAGRSPVGGGDAAHLKMARSLIFTGAAENHFQPTC